MSRDGACPSDAGLQRRHVPWAPSPVRRRDPRRAVAEAFERAAALDDPAVFLAIADRDGALAGLDPDAPLAGWTVAVKDNIDVAGLPTTAGCPSYAYVPDRSAAVVARLVAAGMTVVGKTNMDQFATGLVGTRSPHGSPRNPVDAALVPGGSSSGSAVAVARGVVDVALGTDTAGSGRVPAAQCRVVGVKPTPGLVPATGVVPAVRSIDCVSVFGRVVADGVRARRVIEGEDPDDPYSWPVDPWPGPVRRVGVPRTVDLDSALDRAAWAATVDRLSVLDGIEVAEIDDDPLRDAGRLLYDGPWVAERVVAVGRHVLAADDADPVVRSIIGGASGIGAAEVVAGQYELASVRGAARRAWAGVDVLVVPTTPGVATHAEVAADPIGRNSRLGRYTNGVNLLGWCAVAVPGVDRADGWPFGVSVLGRPGADDAVAVLAAALAGHAAVPPRPPAGLDVVVAGAHMSAMALNHELTDRGATFVRSTATAPAYRLWAMATTPVARPALEHVGAGGAVIEVEVWRLPWDAVGRFLAGIPAPLALGTVELADGTSETGFVAEPRALSGAADVTSYGGWRRYVAAGARPT